MGTAGSASSCSLHSASGARAARGQSTLVVPSAGGRRAGPRAAPGEEAYSSRPRPVALAHVPRGIKAAPKAFSWITCPRPCGPPGPRAQGQINSPRRRCPPLPAPAQQLAQSKWLRPRASERKPGTLHPTARARDAGIHKRPAPCGYAPARVGLHWAPPGLRASSGPDMAMACSEPLAALA